MGGRGTAAVRGTVSQKADTYTRGKDTYSVSYNEKDKRYYLNVERPLSNGETLREKYRVAYAKDDDKAEIYIKELRTVIKMSEDKNILKLLQNKRSEVERAVSNVESSRTSMVDNEKGWKYPEVTQNVTKLEKSLNSARSANKIQSISQALRKQDARITAEIERLHNGTADVKGSEKALLTERRRVRQLMKRAKI